MDDTDHDLNQLRTEAKSQLASIRYKDAELAPLQAQTARMAYSKALQAALPVALVGDTLKFN